MVAGLTRKNTNDTSQIKLEGIPFAGCLFLLQESWNSHKTSGDSMRQKKELPIVAAKRR